jgi:uncharacterized protein
VGGDQRREATILILTAVLLSGVHFHGSLPWLGPRAELFGWFAVNAVLLLGVPALVIRFGFRERLSAYGLCLGRPRVWGRDLAALAPVVLVAAAMASRLPAVRAFVPRYRPALAEPWLLLPSTLGWGVYFFAWEFFFRAFLLFGLGRRIGRTAIFIQLVPFVMAHYPKSEGETFASIAAGALLGAIAWRGESFLPAWLLHWAAATALNLFMVLWR